MNRQPDENVRRIQRQKKLDKIMVPVILFLMALSPVVVAASLLTKGFFYSFEQYGILWGITFIEIHMCFKILRKTPLHKEKETEPAVQGGRISFIAPLLIIVSCLAFIGMIVLGVNPCFAILVGFYGSYFSIHLL